MVDVIRPWARIEGEIDGLDILRRSERAGRTCYKSEDKITDGSAQEFVKKILSMGHESVIEHVSVTARFVCDRGVTHELVRHRLASFSQESTRYCDYYKDGEIQVIKLCFWDGLDTESIKVYNKWYDAMINAEKAYNELREMGATAQEARSVLPNSLKTEIVVSANLREWRHIFKLRTSMRAHPQMREVMIPLLYEFRRKIPVLFEIDIDVKDKDDRNGCGHLASYIENDKRAGTKFCGYCNDVERQIAAREKK